MRERLALHVSHVLLASFVVGLGAANAVRAHGLFVPVAAVGAALGVLSMPRARPVLAVLALALAGLWLGSARLDAVDHTALAGEIGHSARARVVVVGPARRSRYALRIPARLERFRDLDVSEPVLLELPVGRSPPQGAILVLTGTLAEPRPAEGGFDERAWLRRHGVHAVLRGRDVRMVGRRGGIGGIADRLRGSIAKALSSGVSGERRAVLLGIVLGEDEGLDQELRNDFRASGLYHLLAVSGQNVALVAGGVLLLAWLLGIPRLIGQLGALVSIGGYVMAVGYQPSVIRAGVAGSLASLAWICARERDRWWFLLLGALVLLAWSPYNLLDPGFQLSFSAVTAIFVGVPPLMRRLEGFPIPRPLAGTLAVSAACGLATAPILLVQFGSVPVYSILSNALAAPVVAPLLGLGLAAAAVDPMLPDVAAVLTWVDGWLAAYLVWCAHLSASLPYARLPTGQAVGVTVATLIGVGLVRVLRVRPRTAAVALCAAALFLVAWNAAPDGHLPPPTGLRVTFLDVGQGDSTLVQVPEGSVLVDEGPPEAGVEGQLDRLGVQRLSMIVLTHPQRDHIGGAEDVITGTNVGLVLDPQLAVTAPEERAALRAARSRHDRIVTARAGLAYRIGQLRISVLWPEGPGLPSQDPNDNAVVLLLSYGTMDLLLAADAESNVLLPLRLPPVEIFKVSHHGSADAGLPELLEELRPRVAVIEVGRGNSYGHPTPETLAALAAEPGLAVYRTDENGRVTVESDGRALTVATEK